MSGLLASRLAEAAVSLSAVQSAAEQENMPVLQVSEEFAQAALVA